MSPAEAQQYATLEARGFKPIFIPRRFTEIPGEWRRHINQRYRIIARVCPIDPEPAWVIEFADGFRMVVYCDEILK